MAVYGRGGLGKEFGSLEVRLEPWKVGLVCKRRDWAAACSVFGAFVIAPTLLCGCLLRLEAAVHVKGESLTFFLWCRLECHERL